MSTPSVEVFARPRGAVQWQCPSCGSLHGSTQQIWRTGTLTCTRCQRQTQVGVGFSTSMGADSCLMMGSWTKATLPNRLNPTGDPVSGRVYGRMDFECPKCKLGQEGFADFDDLTLTCKGCLTPYFLQLLLYPYVQGSRSCIPFDWSVLIAKKTVDEPIPTEEADPCSGEIS